MKKQVKYKIIGIILLYSILFFLLPYEGKTTTYNIGQPLELETDYFIIKGQKEGPLVIITAGIHGDETASWMAANILRNATIDCGKLIVFPKINIQAIKSRTRTAEGGLDLNRCFPGNSEGSPMEQLAFNLFTFISNQEPFAVIDLHESLDFHIDKKEYLGQTVIGFQNEKSIWVGALVVEKLNKTITVEQENFFLLNYPVKGSLSWAVGTKLDIISLIIETCQRLNLNTRIDYQLQAIKYIMSEMGVILKWE